MVFDTLIAFFLGCALFRFVIYIIGICVVVWLVKKYILDRLGDDK